VLSKDCATGQQWYKEPRRAPCCAQTATGLFATFNPCTKVQKALGQFNASHRYVLQINFSLRSAVCLTCFNTHCLRSLDGFTWVPRRSTNLGNERRVIVPHVFGIEVLHDDLQHIHPRLFDSPLTEHTY